MKKKAALKIKEPENSVVITSEDPKHIKRVESFVKKHLRRVSLEWDARNEAEVAARVERGKSKCAQCQKIINNYRVVIKDGQTKRAKNFHMDHISPVQPIGIEIDLITWIHRLLCPKANFALLCIPCHESKTAAENMLRKIKKRIY